MTLLDVSDVSLSFGGVQALTNVSFSVREGEIFSIIGPNGAGKTTLLNCISGRYKPYPGSIRMRGVEMVGLKPHDRPSLAIARTFQNIALFPSESVIDNVLVGGDHHLKAGALRSCLYWTRLGCAKEELEARREAIGALETLELSKYLTSPVADLPYGVQKRIELARAMVSKPKLLLLDEPMAGMTYGEKQKLSGHVRNLNKEEGVTIIMIEHDMSVVMEISDHILVLDFGQIIAEGNPEEVMNNPEVRKAYLGEDI